MVTRTPSHASNEALPSYSTTNSAEDLPEYELNDLTEPKKAHTQTTHAETAAPAPARPEDYVQVQQNLNFDAEANIASGNAPTNVSIDVSYFCFQICVLMHRPNTFARINTRRLAAIADFGSYCCSWSAAQWYLGHWPLVLLSGKATFVKKEVLKLGGTAVSPCCLCSFNFEEEKF